MIYLLSGPVNSGKTTWVLNDFNEHPDADGFACKKVWLNGLHVGYDLFHLATGLSCPFIRVPEHLPPDWEEAARLGDRFSFNSAGLLFARHITQNAILNHAGRFYLDEVGPLELSGQGFNHLLEALLGADIDLVMVVRTTLLQRVIETFRISDYRLIDL